MSVLYYGKLSIPFGTRKVSVKISNYEGTEFLWLSVSDSKQRKTLDSDINKYILFFVSKRKTKNSYARMQYYVVVDELKNNPQKQDEFKRIFNNSNPSMHESYRKWIT